MPNFDLLAQFGEEIRVRQNRKFRKTNQETLFETYRRCKESETLKHLKSTYKTNVDFLASFGEEIGKDQPVFRLKKGENSPSSSINWPNKRLIFVYVKQLFWFSIYWYKRGTSFAIFVSQYPNRPHSWFGYNWILIHGHRHSKISNLPPIQAYGPNFEWFWSASS